MLFFGLNFQVREIIWGLWVFEKVGPLIWGSEKIA